MIGLIICNTPYQVFNAINILSNDFDCNHINMDILIDESFSSFKDSKRIGARLLNSGLCRNVYYSKRKTEEKHKTKIHTLMYLNKRDHTEEYDFSDKSIISEKYDVIWVGDTNHIGSSLIMRNIKCEAKWYDDGLSTYAYSPRGFGVSERVDKFMKLLRVGSYGYKPTKLYVNNAEIARTKDFQIAQLPRLDSNNVAREYIRNIFDYNESSSIVKKSNIIYLGQIISSMDGYNGLEVCDLLRSVEKSGTEVIIRKHPRENEHYTGFSIDDGLNLWEMECIENINERHILIACCSTAQVSPKLIAGKEPYLIFLYKILLRDESALRKTYDGVFYDAKKMYINKNKIYAPVDEDDFNNVLLKIEEEKK